MRHEIIALASIFLGGPLAILAMLWALLRKNPLQHRPLPHLYVGRR
jgi:hypothetical protein